MIYTNLTYKELRRLLDSDPDNLELLKATVDRADREIENAHRDADEAREARWYS